MAVSYWLSRTADCCSSWDRVAATALTWAWAALIWVWFGAGPGAVVGVVPVAPAGAAESSPSPDAPAPSSPTMEATTVPRTKKECDRRHPMPRHFTVATPATVPPRPPPANGQFGLWAGPEVTFPSHRGWTHPVAVDPAVNPPYGAIWTRSCRSPVDGCAAPDAVTCGRSREFPTPGRPKAHCAG